MTRIETVALQVRREAAWTPPFGAFDDPYLALSEA